jgi:hypothetical protein
MRDANPCALGAFDPSRASLYQLLARPCLIKRELELYMNGTRAVLKFEIVEFTNCQFFTNVDFSLDS